MATDVIQIKYEADMAQLQAELKTLTQANTKLIKQEKDFGAAATKAGNDAAGAASKASSETDKLAGKTKQVDGSFSQLGKTIGAAFALDRVRAFITEAVKAAAAAEGIEAAFNRIAPEGTLDKLRQATKNTVSDVQLMTAAVKANNFQVPLQNLPKLFEFAQRRARETGESVDYLVESIVLGIGRKSPLILDNLGISAVRLREKFKDISEEEMDVAQVAKAVQEIVTEETAKMGTSVETTADKFAQFTATLENLKKKGGDAIISIGIYWAEVAKNFSWRDIAPMGLLGGDAFEKASEKLAELNRNNRYMEVFNNSVTESAKSLSEFPIDKLEKMLELVSKDIKTGFFIGEDAFWDKARMEGLQKSLTDELTRRKEAEGAKIQLATFTDQQLQNLADKGDARASKELAKRKKQRDDAVKADKAALDKKLKDNDRFYEELENKQKERFVNGELTEQELEDSLQKIQSHGLAKRVSILKTYNAKTKEVAQERADMLFDAESKAVDMNVALTKEAAADLEKAEKERLESILKANEEYWQRVETANLQMLEGEVINQQEYDKLTIEQQKQSLVVRLQLLKDFGAKTELSEEEINKQIFDTEKELNKLRADDHKKTEDEKVKKAAESAEERRKIEEELQSQVKNLLSNFIDYQLKTTQAETAAKEEALDREEAAIDQKLQNEIIGEQQAEAAKEEIANRRRALKNEQAQRDKNAAIAQAVIDGIAATVKALADGGPVLAAIVGTASAVQLGLLAAAPLPQYKDGVIDLQGPGTETSDSIIARLSKGESVIKAKATRRYKDELKVINKGDESFQEYIRTKYVMPELEGHSESETDRIEKVVKQVLVNAKFNDRNIVNAIKGKKGATAADIDRLGNRIERKSRVDSFINRHK